MFSNMFPIGRRRLGVIRDALPLLAFVVQGQSLASSNHGIFKNDSGYLRMMLKNLMKIIENIALGQKGFRCFQS